MLIKAPGERKVPAVGKSTTADLRAAREAAFWSVSFVKATSNDTCTFAAHRSTGRGDADYPWLVEGEAHVERSAVEITELRIRPNPLRSAPPVGLRDVDLSRIPLARIRRELVRQIATHVRDEVVKATGRRVGPNRRRELAYMSGLVVAATHVVPPPQTKGRGAPRKWTDEFLFDFHRRYFAARDHRDGRAFMADLADEMEPVAQRFVGDDELIVDEELVTYWLRLGVRHGFKRKGQNGGPGPKYEAWERGERIGGATKPRPFSVDDMGGWTDAEVDHWVNTGERPASAKRRTKGKKAHGK